jgi:hypothetical protein
MACVRVKEMAFGGAASVPSVGLNSGERVSICGQASCYTPALIGLPFVASRWRHRALCVSGDQQPLWLSLHGTDLAHVRPCVCSGSSPQEESGKKFQVNPSEAWSRETRLRQLPRAGAFKASSEGQAVKRNSVTPSTAGSQPGAGAQLPGPLIRAYPAQHLAAFPCRFRHDSLGLG